MKTISTYRLLILLWGLALLLGIGVSTVNMVLNADDDQIALVIPSEDSKGGSKKTDDNQDGEEEGDSRGKEKSSESEAVFQTVTADFTQIEQRKPLKVCAPVQSVRSITLDIIAPPPEG